MKRFFAMLLALVTVICFAGCGNDDIKGTVKPKSQSTKEFVSGETDGSVYENEFLGLGCQLPSGWYYHTEEQIKQINQAVAESADEEFANALEKADIIYDMSAYSNDNSATISVSLEKGQEDLDLKKFAEETIRVAQESYTSLGYSDFEGEVTSAEIEDKKFTAVNISVQNGANRVYTKSVYIKCDQYIACIAINARSQDTVDNLLKEFYLLG